MTSTIQRILETTKGYWKVDHEFITHKEIADRLHLNPAHVRDRLTKRPDFPRPFVFGGARRWKAQEVDLWIEGQQKRPDARRSSQAA